MTVVTGGPWPGGEYGEVCSPSGRRAYLAAQAGQIAGCTARWATKLARAGDVVESERGHVSGRQGGPAWFLIADSFESYLQARGLWPPQPAGATPEWQQLMALQSADLEAARREIAKLRQENDELLAVRNNLLDMIAKLTEVAKTTPPT